MSGCSRIEALLHSGEEMARLIAELHNLRMRVRLAEARALARRHFAARKPRRAIADLNRRAVAVRPSRAVSAR